MNFHLLKHLLVLSGLAVISSPQSSGIEFACHKIDKYTWFIDKLEHLTCFMTHITDVLEPLEPEDFTSMKNRITGLNVEGQRKIEYLPENIGEVLPQVNIYDAGSCSIKTISKENFINMRHLRKLWLPYNQIERIPKNAFIGAKNLTDLALDHNKIMYLSPATFRSLKRLENVWLADNKCIQKNFFGFAEVLKIPRTVEDSCGYCETEDYTAVARSSSSYLVSLKCDAAVAEASSLLRSKNDELITKVMRLENQLNASNLEKQTALDQHKDMLATLKLKLQEVEQLSTDLGRKNELIIEKDAKIEYLKKKLEALAEQN